MKHMLRVIVIVGIFALSLALLPYLGLPYRPLEVTASQLNQYGPPCLIDVNTNNQIDVADIMYTAHQGSCSVELHLLASHWHQPWAVLGAIPAAIVRHT